MSSKLPSINTNKRISLVGDEQDYNFTNKEKKRRDSAQQRQSPLQMIEDLRRKIQQQKSEIDNRNATIKGLQRNFQSLSVIVKTEKTQNAALRSQLQELSNGTSALQQRNTSFHQQLIKYQNQNKSLKSQLQSLKIAHSECSEINFVNENLKRNLTESQKCFEKLMQKYSKMEQEKLIIDRQVMTMRSLDKEKRALNERIIDLEDEVRKMTDASNAASFRNQRNEDDISRIKAERQKMSITLEQKDKWLRQTVKKKQNLEEETQVLRRENQNYVRQLEKLKRDMGTKEVMVKIKMDDEEHSKAELKSMLKQVQSAKRENSELRQQINKLRHHNHTQMQLIQTGETEIKALRKQNQVLVQKNRVRQNEYLLQIGQLTSNVSEQDHRISHAISQNSKLTSKLLQQSERILTCNKEIDSLNKDILQIEQRTKEFHQRYSQYIEQIDKISPQMAIIMSEGEYRKMHEDSGQVMREFKAKIRFMESEVEVREARAIQMNNSLKKQSEEKEIMKDYIESLQLQLGQKTKQLKQNAQKLQQCEQQLESVNNLIEEERSTHQHYKKLVEKQKGSFEKQMQEEKSITQRQLRQLRLRAEKAQQQREISNRLLAKYRQEQEKLKQLISRQQEQSARLTSEKQIEIRRLSREKQQEIDRQRQNNKLLWTDNKKLKDMELQLRRDAQKEIEKRQKDKEQQIALMKRELQARFKREISNARVPDESNASQVRRLLNQKSNQMKTLTEKYDKMLSDLQFYKNRNKQLQGVVARSQKKFKEAKTDLEGQNKTNRQQLILLEDRLKATKSEHQQIELKIKNELRRVSQQLEKERRKFASIKIEEKKAIIDRSLDDMDTSLKTLQNTLSCNYCMEVVKQCVRVSQCGHIYCKKCKAGYEPNCGQCKKKGHILNDRMIDDSVSKADYMRILLAAVRDDLGKISLKQA